MVKNIFIWIAFISFLLILCYGKKPVVEKVPGTKKYIQCIKGVKYIISPSGMFAADNVTPLLSETGKTISCQEKYEYGIK